MNVSLERALFWCLVAVLSLGLDLAVLGGIYPWWQLLACWPLAALMFVWLRRLCVRADDWLDRRQAERVLRRFRADGLCAGHLYEQRNRRR